MKKLALLLFPLAVLHAAEPRAAGWLDARFAAMDADHDGKLSTAEAAPLAALLGGADADKDSFITLDEVKAHLARETGKKLRDSVKSLADMEERFKQLDKNGDGTLDAEERKSVSWLMYLDTDQDGKLTLDEARKALAKFTGGNGGTPPTELAPVYEPAGSSPRQQPRPLKPGDCGIATRIPDCEVAGLEGGARHLAEFAGSRGTVIALVSTSCPVGRRYLPALARLEKEYAAKGFGFVFLAPNDTDSAADLKAAGLSAAICRANESSPALAALGARSTTDVFVLDAARTLVYRGAIDDQYGLGYSRDRPETRLLVSALDAVLAGKSVALPATEAPGCALEVKPAPAAEPGLVTWHNQISRLVQANCLECHRTGGVAPFQLETLEQVSAKAGMIKKMVTQGQMPPWFASAPAAGRHTPWLNDRSLTPAARDMLLTWLDHGRQAGNPAEAPLPRTWPGEWTIGTPDVTVQIPQPIAVKAEGTMPYQEVTVDPHIDGEKYVSAWEVLPTAREVVHHVLVFVTQAGKRGHGDDTGSFLAVFVPGNNSAVYPAGFAKHLPAGSKLHFQIHYTPNGKATEDQVRVGLRFAAEKPAHIIEVAGIAKPGISIPPGADNHAEAAGLPVMFDVKVLGFMPHMHVRGKAFRYEVILPGGEVRTLLDVPRYDFNWQLAYHYAEPPTIPAGSTLRATGWYDNSSGNPANPDPAKTVKWGRQTYEEMMLGYVEYYRLTPAPKTASK